MRWFRCGAVVMGVGVVPGLLGLTAELGCSGNLQVEIDGKFIRTVVGKEHLKNLIFPCWCSRTFHLCPVPNGSGGSSCMMIRLIVPPFVCHQLRLDPRHRFVYPRSKPGWRRYVIKRRKFPISPSQRRSPISLVSVCNHTLVMWLKARV